MSACKPPQARAAGKRSSSERFKSDGFQRFMEGKKASRYPKKVTAKKSIDEEIPRTRKGPHVLVCDEMDSLSEATFSIISHFPITHTDRKQFMKKLAQKKVNPSDGPTLDTTEGREGIILSPNIKSSFNQEITHQNRKSFMRKRAQKDKCSDFESCESIQRDSTVQQSQVCNNQPDVGKGVGTEEAEDAANTSIPLIAASDKPSCTNCDQGKDESIRERLRELNRQKEFSISQRLARASRYVEVKEKNSTNKLAAKEEEDQTKQPPKISDRLKIVNKGRSLKGKDAIEENVNPPPDSNKAANEDDSSSAQNTKPVKQPVSERFKKAKEKLSRTETKSVEKMALAPEAVTVETSVACSSACSENSTASSKNVSCDAPESEKDINQCTTKSCQDLDEEKLTHSAHEEGAPTPTVISIQSSDSQSLESFDPISLSNDEGIDSYISETKTLELLDEIQISSGSGSIDKTLVQTFEDTCSVSLNKYPSNFVSDNPQANATKHKIQSRDEVEEGKIKRMECSTADDRNEGTGFMMRQHFSCSTIPAVAASMEKLQSMNSDRAVVLNSLPTTSTSMENKGRRSGKTTITGQTISGTFEDNGVKSKSTRDSGWRLTPTFKMLSSVLLGTDIPPEGQSKRQIMTENSVAPVSTLEIDITENDDYSLLTTELHFSTLENPEKDIGSFD